MHKMIIINRKTPHLFHQELGRQLTELAELEQPGSCEGPGYIIVFISLLVDNWTISLNIS